MRLPGAVPADTTGSARTRVAMATDAHTFKLSRRCVHGRASRCAGRMCRCGPESGHGRKPIDSWGSRRRRLGKFKRAFGGMRFVWRLVFGCFGVWLRNRSVEWCVDGNVVRLEGCVWMCRGSIEIDMYDCCLRLWLICFSIWMKLLRAYVWGWMKDVFYGFKIMFRWSEVKMFWELVLWLVGVAFLLPKKNVKKFRWQQDFFILYTQWAFLMLIIQYLA